MQQEGAAAAPGLSGAEEGLAVAAPSGMTVTTSAHRVGQTQVAGPGNASLVI